MLQEALHQQAQTLFKIHHLHIQLLILKMMGLEQRKGQAHLPMEDQQWLLQLPQDLAMHSTDGMILGI